MIDAIFLDFDGVILESVDVKGWAFGKLFDDYPQHQKEIIDFHYANGGLPRFDKFRHIYKNILNRPLSDDHFDYLCDKFSQIVFNRVLECEFVKGADLFLEKYYKKTDLYIISGTPQEEMTRVVDARNLKKYFKGVYGSPITKTDWTRKILDENKYDVDKCFWVGDAKSDVVAANNTDIKFFGRIIDGESYFEGFNVFQTFSTMMDVDNFLTRSS